MAQMKLKRCGKVTETHKKTRRWNLFGRIFQTPIWWQTNWVQQSILWETTSILDKKDPFLWHKRFFKRLLAYIYSYRLMYRNFFAISLTPTGISKLYAGATF